jgi:hypothetical protein
MNTVMISSVLARWPLPRVLILLLAGAFGGLMTDIRVEHVDAVREHSVAWVPIAYCALMTIASFVACIYWNAFTRRIMIALFSLALFVGGAGFYFHNHGKITKVMRSSINAWIDPKMSHSDGPPQLAPMAFAGLGVIGILACLKQFNS